MVIAPFFVIHGERADLEEPADASGSGLFAWLAKLVGPADRLVRGSAAVAICLIVAWQYAFATLILLMALQSLDQEQKEAAEMDGTPAIPFFSTSYCRTSPPVASCPHRDDLPAERLRGD